MTPKQIERLKKKITTIKRILAAEKRKYAAYDDSRGLRYVPVTYYIQLGDYSGGLNYIRWFFKTFADDIGFPDFLFECTIILFKTGKIKEAEQKAFKTYCANTYLFDKFFGRPIIPIVKWEGSNLAIPLFTDYFDYSSKKKEFADFSEWLAKLIARDDFDKHSKKYIGICKRLKTEDDHETQHYLLMQINQLSETI